MALPTQPTAQTSRPCRRHPRGSLDGAVDEFTPLRQRLLRTAYRVLGNWTDAEDVVQDAWVRWQTCDRDAVRCPTAFLVTTTSRLALNAATSARSRREAPAGDLLPDVTDPDGDPAASIERATAADTALTLLADRLSPTERTAFVLRHAFDYPYTRIAELSGLSEANARQLTSRAGKRLAADRGRVCDPDERAKMRRAFTAGCAGRPDQLERELTATAVARGAARRCHTPVIGSVSSDDRAVTPDPVRPEVSP